MAGRNGGGPMGFGLGTGRGMGYCDVSRSRFMGMQNRGWFGMGRGRRGGNGFKFTRSVYSGGYPGADLRSYQRYLEEELNNVNQQLNPKE